MGYLAHEACFWGVWKAVEGFSKCLSILSCACGVPRLLSLLSGRGMHLVQVCEGRASVRVRNSRHVAHETVEACFHVCTVWVYDVTDVAYLAH